MHATNDFHKLLVVFLVIAWAMFQFRSRDDGDLKYKNGNPIRTGTTKNNLNDGVWTWYHKNGKVQITGNFRKGKREDVWKSYDTLGNLLIESTYKNNLLNGPFKQYSSNGKLIRSEWYVSDRLIRHQQIK